MALFKETMLTLGTDGLLHSWVGSPITPPPPPPPPPPGNPTSRITTTLQDGLRLVLSASSSSPGASDSTLIGFAWSMGDGSSFVSSTVDHTYSQPGIYLVTLTVTDSGGLTDSTAQSFTLNVVVAGDLPPVPSFVASSNQLLLQVDATASSDPDGTITSYVWDFGDGGAAVGTTASHTYAAPGAYQVTLLVTDDLGSTNSVVQQVNIVSAPPPVLSNIRSTNSGMSVTVTGTIIDPNGDSFRTVIDWGDGTVTTNATLPASHTYAAIGPWTVVLTATNSHGASDQASVSASPSAGSAPYVNDDGLGTRNGLEPTAATAGVSLVSYSSLAGADVVARAKAAGTTVMSLPPGSYTVPGFSSTSASLATPTSGMIGAGSAQCTLSQVPNSSANAPVGSNVMRLTATNGFLEDFSVVGTAQTVAPYNTWNGIHLNGDNWTIRRLKLQGIAPGNDKAPPGETFGINLFKAYGTILIEDVEIDGQGIGASNLGTNGSGNDSTVPTMFLTVNRMYTHGNHYSGGFALWQTKFDVRSAFNDCVFDDSRCFWNVERCSGTVTLNRPRIGRLKAATTGWDPTTNKTIPGAVGIFCESGNTWGTAASQNFRFIVRDPRNLDGTPYSGPKITINFGSSFVGNTSTKETNFYGSTNFRCFNAAGADISSSFFSYGLGGFN